MGQPKYASGVGMLMIAGTLANVISKIIYSLKAEGRDREPRAFAKPWFCTMLMFLGMAICLPCSLIWRKILIRRSRQKSRSQSPDDGAPLDHETPLLHETESTWTLDEMTEATRAWWHKYDAILWPTIFDLIASALLSVGLLFVTASLYQMVRGTEVLFTAALSVVFLHRRLNSENLWGLAFCAAGLLLVGYAGLLNAENDHQKGNEYASPGQTLLGMLLIVIAEAVQASQIVAEDFLMSASDVELPPVEVVGYEGIFGLAIMAVIVLPLLQISNLGPEGGGLKEDSIESLVMLRNSPLLAWFCAGYVGLMAAYNVAGMMITNNMGALSRTVAETARTLLIWVLNLSLYYKVHLAKSEPVGEPWTKYSWIQGVGFAVLVVGTAIYARGEERHAKEMREKLKARAREGWARVRASVTRLVELAKVEGMEGRVSEEERKIPARPARIAGPARIRVALGLLQVRRRLIRRQREQEQPAEGGETHA